MAIFKNARDRNLPLLTKVYQAETLPIRRAFDGGRINWEELAEFAKSEGYDAEAIRNPRLSARLLGQSWQERFGVPGSAEVAEGKQREREILKDLERQRRALADVCDLARSMMDSLGRRHVFLRQDLGALSTYSSRTVSTLIHEEGGVVDSLFATESDEISPEKLAVNYYRENDSSLQGKIIRALEELLLMAINGKSQLRICAECDSVFVEQKAEPGQMFCSHRCAHRSGQRRRMRALKE